MGVVFKVDIANHPVGAAHQIAGKGLAERGACFVNFANRLQALLPVRQHGVGTPDDGLFHLVAQAGRALAGRAQVAHHKAIFGHRQHLGCAQAARGKVLQAPHLGGNGHLAPGVGYGTEHGHLERFGQCAEHAITPAGVECPGALDPQGFASLVVAHHAVRLAQRMGVEEGGVVNGSVGSRHRHVSQYAQGRKTWGCCGRSGDCALFLGGGCGRLEWRRRDWSAVRTGTRPYILNTLGGPSSGPKPARRSACYTQRPRRVAHEKGARNGWGHAACRQLLCSGHRLGLRATLPAIGHACAKHASPAPLHQLCE